MERDNAKIEFIRRSFKIFHITRNEKKTQKQKWSPFDMLPHPERYGYDVKAEYEDKMLCWHLANGRTDEFERLYAALPASQVEELYALKSTYDYHPPD
ncbi:MAG TPA: hypothetical protein PLW14_09030 [Chlorobiota bacterium]|nr:hypothetical protein [Chlorobiota bacterium]